MCVLDNSTVWSEINAQRKIGVMLDTKQCSQPVPAKPIITGGSSSNFMNMQYLHTMWWDFEGGEGERGRGGEEEGGRGRGLLSQCSAYNELLLTFSFICVQLFTLRPYLLTGNNACTVYMFMKEFQRICKTLMSSKLTFL